MHSLHDLHQARYDGEVRRASLLLGSATRSQSTAQEMAHDVVADAFCEVIRRWDSIENPEAYLSRTVLHGCQRAAKRRRREPAATAAELEQSRLGLSARLDLDQPDELLDAVQQLPWKQRAVVVMKFYEDLTEREIAERMDIRPGSVGPTLNRAMKKLRAAVGEPERLPASDQKAEEQS